MSGGLESVERRWKVGRLTFGFVSQKDEAGGRIVGICFYGSKFGDGHDMPTRAEKATRRGFVMPSAILPGPLVWREKKKCDSRTHLFGLGDFCHIPALNPHTQTGERGDKGFIVEDRHPPMNGWWDMFEGFVRHGAAGGLGVGSG
jgi:hypothetical protein